jgi:hypothetical protein
MIDLIVFLTKSLVQVAVRQEGVATDVASA